MVCTVFGCISTNEHYQGTGLSFDYSANWQLNDSAVKVGDSEQLVKGEAKNNEGGHDAFSISRTPAGNLTQAEFNSAMSSGGWTHLTVDGVDAYKLTQPFIDDPNTKDEEIKFLKNGMIYDISLIGSNPLNNVDAIVDSIHIS